VDILLLDTDVYSYLARADDQRGYAYRRHVEGKKIAICHVTVGEVLFGAIRRDWGQRRIQDLQQRLHDSKLLDFDFEVGMEYALLKSRLRAQGRILADNDLRIAAFALRYSVPLESNNRKHFERIPGLVLISEAP
jgi:tRNA(fMet)-specific endonuclease VapC